MKKLMKPKYRRRMYQCTLVSTFSFPAWGFFVLRRKTKFSCLAVFFFARQENIFSQLLRGKNLTGQTNVDENGPEPLNRSLIMEKYVANSMGPTMLPTSAIMLMIRAALRKPLSL